MRQANWDKQIQQVAGSLRLFVARFTKKNQKQVSARLDALLLEKAGEQGIELALKKKTSFLTVFAWFMSAGIAVAGIAAVSFFVPGPWTRFIAMPQIVSMSLVGIDLQSNGVSDPRPTLTIQTPKTVRGVQFVRANLSISPSVPLDIQIVAETGDITVTPRADLEKGKVYTLTMAPGVPFTDGTYLANEQSWVIPTKAVFDVVSISPRDSTTVPSTAAIEITFSTDEFRLADVTPAISIEPEVAGTFQKVDSRMTFAPKNGLSVGATYTVRISTSAKNQAGEQIPKEYASTFTVAYDQGTEQEAPLTPAISADYRVYNLTKGSEAIRFSTAKISKVAITTYAVTWNEIAPSVNDLLQKGSFTISKEILKKKSVFSKTLSEKPAYDSYYEFEQSFSSLKSGMYVVRFADANKSGVVSYILLFKGDFGAYATTRENKTDADVWTFDYATKKPFAGVELNTVQCNATGCTSLLGKTGNDGYLQITSSKEVDYIVATFGEQVQMLAPQSSYGSLFGFAGNNASRDIFSKIITNKPTFLPGDLLRFSVLLRHREDGEYQKMAEGKKYEAYLCTQDVWIDLVNYQDMDKICVFHKTLTVNTHSQLEGTFALWKRPEGFVLYIIDKANGESLLVDSTYISVGELDKPQTKLTVTTDKLRYVGADTVVVSGRVTNYVDAGIQGRLVSIRPLVGTDEGQIEFSAMQVATDARGNFKVSLKLPTELVKDFTPEVEIQATIIDGENEISESRAIDWDKGEQVTVSAVYNKKEVEYSVPLGSKPTAVLTMESLPDHKLKSGKELKATVIREYTVVTKSEPYYDEELREMVTDDEYENKQEVILEKEVVTGEKGTVSLAIPQTKEGWYVVRIQDYDGVWHVNAEYSLFAVGQYDRFEEAGKINEWITAVHFDGERATVGDKVKLTIESTFRKSKQELVLFTRTTEVTGWQFISQNTKSVDIPITRNMIGGVEVCVLHPMTGYQKNSAGKTRSLGGMMRLACASLMVEDKRQKLSLSLVPETKRVIPGATSNLSVEVKNLLGVGERAAVGITVMDRALFDAAGYKNPSDSSMYTELYESQFGGYTNRGDSGILTRDAEVILASCECGRGGAGEGESPAVRKDFSDNPFWKSVQETDEQGKVTIPVKYGEGITTWVIFAWAVTDDYQIGSQIIEVKTHKDVYLDVDRASRLRVGDEWYPYVRVTNDKATPFTGKIRVSCEGCLEKTLEFDVDLKPFETYEKQIVTKVHRSQKVTLTAQVFEGSTVVDGVAYPIDVRSIGFELPFVLQKAVSKNDKQLSFTIPEGASPLMSTVSLDISSLPLVVEYSLNESASNAKTLELSGLLANLGTLARYNSFGDGAISSEDARVTAQAFTSDLLLRIQPDGSFPFHSYGGTEYPSTIAAAYALKEADQGFGDKLTIDRKTFVQIGEYLRTAIQSDKVSLTEKTQMAYVYARIDQKRAASMVTALNKAAQKETLTKLQRAYLALALQQVGATAEATKLVLAQEAANRNDVASGDYISSEVSEVTTAIQAYLLSKLGLWVEQKSTLEKYQNWLLNSCVSCLDTYNRSLVAALLTGSLLPEQKGNASTDKLVVFVNGKQIATVEYKGNRTYIPVSPTLLVNGNNVFSVTSSSGRKVFVSVRGTIYQTKLPEQATQPQATLAVSAKGVVTGGTVKLVAAGGSGYYVAKVTALEDIPASRIAIYLPSGLSGETWHREYDLDKFVRDNVAIYAFGDFSRSDAYTAEIQPLKKGESQIVVLPFVARRTGVFSGELVQWSIPSKAGSLLVKQGTQVRVD